MAAIKKNLTLKVVSKIEEREINAD